MDLSTYLHLVLSRDLTAGTPPCPVLAESLLVSSHDLQPAATETPREEQIQILLHLAERETAASQGRRGQKGLPRKKVAGLGCWRARKRHGRLVISADYPMPTSCAVCLDDYKESSVVRWLPCKHIFHKQCIDTWLLQNSTCPLDRSSLD